MASILDRYGIKEVMDVTFYEIDSATGKAGKPVLFLDTLKVSTVEQTAETADARGGKGNPKLITWDYGKEISVTLTDALFSPKSMSILLGNGTVINNGNDWVDHTAVLKLDDTGKLQNYFVADVYDSEKGSVRKKVYIGSSVTPEGWVSYNSIASTMSLIDVYSENGTELDNSITASELMSATTSRAWGSSYDGQKIFLRYKTKSSTRTITVTGDTFPGTYYVQGDTYVRSDIDGKDRFFQFIIPKCKVTSQNTITLEAEGDPATFNMSLTVLRPEDGEMMKLVEYQLLGS